MKKYITEYVDYVDNYIKGSNNKKDINNFIGEHLIKISFFQHERFIHLCVTLAYTFIFLIFMALVALSYIFAPIVLILAVFLIFYIKHYFYLENCVQYMYKQYDTLKEIEQKK